ncbi:SDR family NAD(P)-dependent oxidoreductase [Amylibacter sp. SFDW26]|uniref:SDR family NAD(P)-dependent oxidoreductase n=1 Tax=Amylibacter sp. SFDW26 TaxID=2652722 RepID=UPI0012615716|nr:SDR family NAD(P)-dependent oxidoreductase [Amylibacter sp. SFDW26]KAB7616027.1 SDR family NAD(P)-dependent oxidoreductase [Amylibacter sp. SFDW26]
MTLQGKRYWLVGASEGLGREMALQLSDVGVDLVISARTKARLDDLAVELKGTVDVLPIDVNDADNIAEVAKNLGQIDGIIYAAGVYSPMNAQSWDADQVEAMCDINFLGCTRTLGHVVPGFIQRDQGHIVIIGSLSGFRGLPKSIGYSASKSAVMHLAECLYADLRGTGVKVQLLNPGFIKTRMTDKNDFSMPFLMSSAEAAKHAVNAMQKGGFQYNFPRMFSWFFRGANFLPAGLYYRLFG